MPKVDNGDKEDIRQMVETQGMDKETSERAETEMATVEYAYDKGSSKMAKDVEVTSAPAQNLKKKKRDLGKTKKLF